MTRHDSGPADVARFFDREACCSSRSPGAGAGRLRPVSRSLLALLEDAGLAGRSVLDVGSGQGSLAVALAERGAARVTGIDLSPASVAVAEHATERTGVPTRFAVGDASTAQLAPHDVVVLDKVVCCYPDVGALLANTVQAARSVVAIAMPHSRGPRGSLARALVGAENGWRRLRGDPFRAYVHDEVAIVRTLRQHGLVRTSDRHRWTWHIATYERPA
jgi:2-polyprenyl-3-methyl-5-hydroxy-6-metoxy-1,4-benzoquinol methylase